MARLGSHFLFHSGPPEDASAGGLFDTLVKRAEVTVDGENRGESGQARGYRRSSCEDIGSTRHLRPPRSERGMTLV